MEEVDNHILDMAAKACGIENRHAVIVNGIGNERTWNPLENDGDCLRLENDLRISVKWNGMHVTASSLFHDGCSKSFFVKDKSAEDCAKGRRKVSTHVAALIYIMGK